MTEESRVEIRKWKLGEREILKESRQVFGEVQD